MLKRMLLGTVGGGILLAGIVMIPAAQSVPARRAGASVLEAFLPLKGNPEMWCVSVESSARITEH